MAANIKTIAINLDSAADASDIPRVLLYDGDAITFFGEQIGRSQPRRTRANNRHINHILALNCHIFPLREALENPLNEMA